MKTFLRRFLALSVFSSIAVGASAQFSGLYSHPWWFDVTVPTSTASWAGDENSLTIVGNNINNGSAPDYARYTHWAEADGLVSFDWLYTSIDQGQFDHGGYMINGVRTELADNSQAPASGSVSFNVVTGDIFGFYVYSADGQEGPGILQITHFSAPVPVPEPATMTCLGLGLTAIIAKRRRKSVRSSS